MSDGSRCVNAPESMVRSNLLQNHRSPLTNPDVGRSRQAPETHRGQVARGRQHSTIGDRGPHRRPSAGGRAAADERSNHTTSFSTQWEDGGAHEDVALRMAWRRNHHGCPSPHACPVVPRCLKPVLPDAWPQLSIYDEQKIKGSSKNIRQWESIKCRSLLTERCSFHDLGIVQLITPCAFCKRVLIQGDLYPLTSTSNRAVRDLIWELGIALASSKRPKDNQSRLSFIK
jgi:hypothetical protein